jgi:hypothetical protein
MHRLTVRDGQITTPEGLRYRLLWLPDCPRMVPETLERMLALVQQGAILVGEPPQGLATLTGGTRAKNRFRKAIVALWGEQTITVRTVGKGRVISGMSLGDALDKLAIQPDLSAQGVDWTHRQTDGAEWYFVSSQTEQEFRGTIRFRAGGAAELWNPLTGEMRSAGFVRREDGTSLLDLELTPSGSIFVVFRNTGRATSDSPGNARSLNNIPLTGSWNLAFPAGWGAPESMQIEKLMSWTQLELSPEAQAFSGTATYTTEFNLPSLSSGSQVELDLGRVEVIALVQLNGKSAGTLWTPPYRLDVTGLVQPGVNHLTVEITSTWFNRLVYDAGLDETERKTWTISGPAKDRPLLPSGLLGPVRVQISQANDSH